MSKIIRLSSTNYKRLKAVEIKPDPDGNLVVVAGKNGQGKSSVLDSITAALGGVNAKTTPKPIRDGEERAEIVLETEDLIVTRKFTAAGSTLTVKSTDGATYGKGQAKLDDLLGKLSLDPLAFTQLSDRDQLATLIELVELPFDPSKLDAERGTVFEARTEVNRKVKELAAQAGQYISRPADLPEEEVSVTNLLDQYRAGQELNGKIDSAKAALSKWAAEVARIQEELDYAVKQLNEANAHAETAPNPVDLTAIQQQIDGAEETNRLVRHHAEGKQVKARLEDVTADAKKLTAKLAEIDKRKADGLAKAKFPVDALGFDEGGVTYQGVPFKQASSAEQLRVSLAMAIALNPALRVIRIADGSLLDADNLALIEAMAKEHDMQVWLEVVSDSAGGRGVVIEDGEVMGD
jgi:ATPase involved in DNA repair